MNQITPTQKIEIIPASAPFSEAQRSWLNGFLAGLLTTDGAVPLPAEQGAALLPAGDGDDTVEGYHLFAGGGFGPQAEIGQEVYHDLKAEEAPKTVEKLLKAYLKGRSSADETFLAFARRHDGETLRKLANAEMSS